jgi:segregation and condensation protein B
MNFNFKKILKALLLSTPEPISVKALQAIVTNYIHEYTTTHLARFDDIAGINSESSKHAFAVPNLVTSSQIRDTLDALQVELEEAAEAYRILQTPTGYRIVIAPEYTGWIRFMRNEPAPAKLSQAALETLSLIAYHQPITRPEMEAIRGVSVDNPLNRLLELELVRLMGKSDLPGKPFQYGTTERFLEFCGITTLADLPKSDAFSKADLNQMIETAIYPEKPEDQQFGFFEDLSDHQSVESASEFNILREKHES